jgi:hypothetical protein
MFVKIFIIFFFRDLVAKQIYEINILFLFATDSHHNVTFFYFFLLFLFFQKSSHLSLHLVLRGDQRKQNCFFSLFF